MPDMITLATSERKIDILEESSIKSIDIGTILLQDNWGVKVRGIVQKATNDPVEVVRMIYERWLREDEKHSWKKLTWCFRVVNLNTLASDIEKHFGINPSQEQASRLICN